MNIYRPHGKHTLKDSDVIAGLAKTQQHHPSTVIARRTPPRVYMDPWAYNNTAEYGVVSNQIVRMSARTVCCDALRLTKKAKSLPRVTAYATGKACFYRLYRFGDLVELFNPHQTACCTNPRQIDDVIYTAYLYGPQSPPSSALDESRSQ
ncbi:hypothetical protein V8E52_002012 [Russula decolorans]